MSYQVRDEIFDAPVDLIYIGGDWVRPSTAKTVDVRDASTGAVMFGVADAQEADIERAIQAARTAFDRGPWPRLTHQQRAGYMRAMAEKLQKAESLLSTMWASQSGTTYATAQFTAPAYPGMFNYYASLADSYDFEERHVPTGGGEVGLLRKEPVGVVAAIVPWNAPMVLMGYKVAPALIAGCTVIIKASPEAPAEAYVLAQIADSVGIPPGVINVVSASRPVSELLVRDPRVDKVSFTGSTAAGRRIASLVGERIGRATLELGGKSAAVVLDDYDIATAATAIAGQAAALTGQACSALTRVIVSRGRHDDMVDALAAEFAAIHVGDAFDPASHMGPLATERQLNRVKGYIAKGRDEGAALAVGGGRPAHLEQGWFIEPTVFGKVDNTSVIAREEIFGPVLTVIPADDEEHAVELANDTQFGLNNSVFTGDARRAYQVASQLKSGTVGHNAFRSDFGIAFGGYKQSGIGREGGTAGVEPYLESKTIILDGDPGPLGG